MTATTEVVTVPKENALQVFSAEQGLDPYLAKIRAEIESFVPDVSTAKGRKEIASIAYKVAQSKTALDNVGKDLVAELKEVPKKIDAERKRMRDLLDGWRDEVRAPLTEWEAEESARVAQHQAGIDKLKDLQEADATRFDCEYLRQCIANVEGVAIGEHWEEYEAEAARVKDKALTALRDALVIREKHEAELAAIAKFQAEQAERDAQAERDRIAQEAAERATREAEQRAQAERDAAAQREADLIEQAAQQQRQAEQAKRDAEAAAEQARLNAELAEQRRIAAEKQAELDRIDAEKRQAEAVERAAQAERQRQADEAALIEAEAKAREADRAHKSKVNREAVAAFVAGGMTEEAAKQAVTLIAKRQIPAIAISY